MTSMPLRIAFITYEFPPDTGKGGIGTYTKQVATMLAGQGWDVHVFSGSHHRQVTTMEDGFYVHRVLCNDPHDFKIKLLPVFTKEHTQLVFNLIESPEIHGNAAEIKKAYPLLPLVVRLHAPNWLVENLKKTYIPFFAKLRYLLGALRRGRIDAGYWNKYEAVSDPDRAFTLLADGVSAPSEMMKSWAVKEWKIAASGITVLPNPFTPPLALLQIPIAVKAVNKEIVFFGRLNVLKGLVNAGMAMNKILKEFPAWHFKVIGDDGPGPEAGINMRLWMQQKLKDVIDRVQFLDGLLYEELPAAIGKAEIVLLPSLFESFSYTCAEAMAAGKAVLGSSNTGMADMIQHRSTGMLADAQNVNAIYTAIKELIQDDGLRYRISVQARERIRAQFNAAQLSERYMAYYKNTLQNQ